jgi:membrane protein
LPPSVRFLLTRGPVLLAVAWLATLFYFVPNTRVRLRDARAVRAALAALPIFQL